jgi:hypothetical protein
VLFKHFGFTVEHVIETAKAVLAQHAGARPSRVAP